jgi:hypothetical protein
MTMLREENDLLIRACVRKAARWSPEQIAR